MAACRCSPPSAFKTSCVTARRLISSPCLNDRRRGARFPLAARPSALAPCAVLLWREKIPPDWLPKVFANLPAVLVDHAHLERKAAITAITLEKYRDLFSRVEELNAIAIEELQHFQLVLALLQRRGIPFSQPLPSPWIAGLMHSVR